VIRSGSGSELKRSRLIKKVGKFRRELEAVGGSVNSKPQRFFVEALVKDGQGKFEELMKQLCFARLLRGDFSNWEGWQFRNEWATAAYHPSIVEKRWRPEKKVKSVAVLGEQGIGDEIMYASCIPDIQRLVPEVVVECDPRLQAVLERSLNINTRPRSDIVYKHLGPGSVKYLTQEREEESFIPIGDLPKFFRRSQDDFPRKPFLRPLPEMVEKWSHLRGRTGIAWRGRVGQFKPTAFKLNNPVALQYDAWDYELEGMEVPQCDLHNDIEDLFGICANLERVVSVTQTVVHIAGSQGTRVDVVMPPKGSSRVENAIPFRYTKPRMFWYPDVRVHETLHGFLNS
jgi:hypothetical protein